MVQRLLADAAGAADAVVAHELAVCSRVTDLYPKLYMGWTYRHWIAQQLPRHADLVRERAALHAWLAAHVSDHAAAHHLQGVLARMSACAFADGTLATALAAHTIVDRVWLAPLADASDRPADAAAWTRALWLDEWQRLTRLLTAYPGHDALWHHRRFLVAAIVAVIEPCLGALGTHASSSRARGRACAHAHADECARARTRCSGLGGRARVGRRRGRGHGGGPLRPARGGSACLCSAAGLGARRAASVDGRPHTSPAWPRHLLKSLSLLLPVLLPDMLTCA